MTAVLPGVRLRLLVSIAVVIALAASFPAFYGGDAGGWAAPFAMAALAALTGLWAGLPAAVPLAAIPWLLVLLARFQFGGEPVFESAALWQPAALIGVAVVCGVLRREVSRLDDAAKADPAPGLEDEVDQETGAFKEEFLRGAIERELVRSRRFGREFALMLAAIDPLRLKFDYRDEEKWRLGLMATSRALLKTRAHIDRVFRYGDRGFALLLPETGASEIGGLLRRLARESRRVSPAAGEPGGPLPLCFGVTFFPECATTTGDLLKRAEVALRVAEKSPSRVRLDGAEAPDMAPPELDRRLAGEDEAPAVEGWLAAEVPEEETPGVLLAAPDRRVAPAIPGVMPSVHGSKTEVAADAFGDAAAALLERMDATLELIRSLKRAA